MYSNRQLEKFTTERGTLHNTGQGMPKKLRKPPDAAPPHNDAKGERNAHTDIIHRDAANPSTHTATGPCTADLYVFWAPTAATPSKGEAGSIVV